MRSALKFLLVTLASGFLAAQASAGTVYTFDAGFVTVSAAKVTDLATPIWEDLLVLDDGGGTSFIEFDPFGAPSQFGVGTIDDFLISIPTQGPFMVIEGQSYGTYEEFTIESAILTPGAGYSTEIGFGGPTSWSIIASPISIDAYYSATGSPSAPDLNNISAGLTDGELTGTIDLVNGQLELHLNNVIMSTFSGIPFGEPDLQVTGDFTWIGSIGTVVPEPSTGLLVGLGLIGLAVRSRR